MTGPRRLNAAVTIAQLEEHIEDIDVTPDGGSAALASVSGEVAMVDLGRTGSTALMEAGPRVVHTHAAEAVRARWSPDGALLATGSNDGSVAFLRPDGALITEFRTRGWCSAIAWAPDGTSLAAAFGREVIRLSPEGTELSRLGPHPTTVTSLAWRHDGRRLAASAGGNVWWYEDAIDPVRILEGAGAAIAIAVSPDDRWVAVGNQDASVHCWELRDEGDELAMSGFAGKVTALSWAPDATLLAVGNLGRVSVWDFTGNGPKGAAPRDLLGHEGRTNAVLFHPGAGQGEPVLATCGDDDMVRLWTADRTRSDADAESRVAGRPVVLRWLPDATGLLVGCADGTVQRIDVVQD